MIDLYAANTMNNRKIAVMLEEAALDYRVRRVDLGKGEQFAPDFLALSPSNKTPAIVDHDAPGGPLSVFESGAILIYLAEKTGRFLPADIRGRTGVIQWLMWQMAGFGPMLGQFNHFLTYAKTPNPGALERYEAESLRLFGVLDRQLAAAPYAAGSAYSIADMAIYPWSVLIRPLLEPRTGQAFPAVAAWEAKLALRPALGRGMSALSVPKP
jgi:GST-like protein